MAEVVDDADEEAAGLVAPVLAREEVGGVAEGLEEHALLDVAGEVRPGLAGGEEVGAEGLAGVSCRGLADQLPEVCVREADHSVREESDDKFDGIRGAGPRARGIFAGARRSPAWRAWPREGTDQTRTSRRSKSTRASASMTTDVADQDHQAGDVEVLAQRRRAAGVVEQREVAERADRLVHHRERVQQVHEDAHAGAGGDAVLPAPGRRRPRRT